MTYQAVSNRQICIYIDQAKHTFKKLIKRILLGQRVIFKCKEEILSIYSIST